MATRTVVEVDDLDGLASRLQSRNVVFISPRVASVQGQLTEPYPVRPEFNQNGGEVVSGFLLQMAAPQGAIYYIGEFPVHNLETYRLEVAVAVAGESEPLMVVFRQQFYTE